MSKHTPGPWKAVRSVTCGHLRAEHNHRADPREEWTDDDIQLIDAAPDMLSACKHALRVLMKLAGPMAQDARIELQSAIAKAKGESA